MSSFQLGSSPLSATIVIETIPITSNMEEVDGHPGMPCFLSTAWDLSGDRPIDQRISYGGTLAQATLRSPKMLAPLVTGSNDNTRRHHLNCFYLYHGIRHEICATHNGRVWLKPLDAKLHPSAPTFICSAPSYPGAEVDQAHPLVGKTSQCNMMSKPSGSLSQQPGEVQELIRNTLDSLSRYESLATKSELSKCLQSVIWEMNHTRPEDRQLKIPSTRTMYRIIDDYSNLRKRQAPSVTAERRLGGSMSCTATGHGLPKA
jgi:hypothetical protein